MRRLIYAMELQLCFLLPLSIGQKSEGVLLVLSASFSMREG